MTLPAFAHQLTHRINDPRPTDALPFPGAFGLPAIGISAEPVQILQARFLAPFADGREPEVRHAPFTCSSDQPCELPSEHIVAQYRRRQSSFALIETPTVTAFVQHNCGTGGWVMVRARTAAEADRACDEALSWFTTENQELTKVDVDFWQRANGMFTTTRSIEAPDWTDAHTNYPDEVRVSLDDLMTTTLEAPAGRIMLWHGPPGTGKTTAIRTLARAWQDQARLQVVLDPESVFVDAAALMQVLLDSRTADTDRWRVLVIEDADELVRVGNDRAGRSLSRMLNVGDGIIGQGLKVLILLTTNEPPERLHPALSRPGRCMSQLWFRKFQRHEAHAAFPNIDLPDGHELSLAEIMNGQPSTDTAPPPTGTYL